MTDSTDGDGAGSEPTHADVVTAFLRHRGEILLLRRSDAVGTYTGQWGGVSGFAEGNPNTQVRTEIREETGLSDAEIDLIRSGRPVSVTDPELDREWTVHPYLFDVDSRDVDLSEEHDALEWTPPTTICIDPDRQTVPALWTAYERVAPTVRSITADDEHGAAALSIRALEVLRDRAGLVVAERADSDDGDDVDQHADTDTDAAAADAEEEWAELTALAERLLEARPSMAVLRNRVNRAMAEASEAAADDVSVPDAAAVLESTLAGIDRATAADDDAAATAADVIDGAVLTLSRSGTVVDALRAGAPSRVFVAESRPALEGVAVAEELAAGGVDCPVTLHTDAAAAHVLATESIDRVLVGADTIRHDGAVVNKTGTRALAAAAAHEDVPVTVVAATDKISTREEVALESAARDAVYDGDAAIDVLNPTFDITPADCVTEFATERGLLAPAEIEETAENMRALESWRDR
ncbi:translation initiation factor aIF-2B alpha subunit [Natrialba magadii ATCC 43099]|uniref:Initiation factor 2B-like protein n=1 Tax=Natrialba magadii (strain ATCC 43099 / DSM 3394 / CCM 3739 / CIP 104546 / IAM 13178 / JCM 8861 / NBRC 102185 / NCIMB 2190 / MS3) TaxID=547559 RepID=D3SU94_NATMM|nr:NUDIX domain-containing protein [Natrialba magadii]ADD05152.1 translation initiation factor aIF-2B alpha subunit [Natrialba magadii ATCC 43099]ELY23190.1 initiation factor 2B-like protein [Natrialba magadii ATCC 43099]